MCFIKQLGHCVCAPVGVQSLFLHLSNTIALVTWTI